MNYLESKTLKIVKDKLDKTLVLVMDLRLRINNLNRNEVSQVDSLMMDCDEIVNDGLKEIDEWLHALRENKTQ